MRTIYRRALLIATWIGPIDPTKLDSAMTTPSDPSEFFSRFDISARYDPANGLWIPNSLEDLVKRENRFGHYYAYDTSVTPPLLLGFPHVFPNDLATAALYMPAGPGSSLEPLLGERQGEDVMLNDVLAFDLRVFDIEAQLIDFGDSGNVVGPSDAGWRHNYNTTLNPIVGSGAYVDLNYGEKYIEYATLVGITPAPTIGGLVQTQFFGPPLLKSQLAAGVVFGGVYDTWSFHYENDGIDQDSTNDNGAGIDQGTNKLDDVVPQNTPPSPEARNGTDDIGERETSPPYNVPLRGIQVKLRVYDPDSRQIREATVTKGFN